MFDRIAKRYDLINRLLSFGQDPKWRRRVADMLPSGSLRLLDVATGTGDLALAIQRERPQASIIGLDPSTKMLDVARTKSTQIEWMIGEAEHLPFLDASFDAVTIGFGIRNAHDLPKALKEMHRVLKPNGQLLILEFSKPFLLIRPIALFHLRVIVPFVGRLVSGEADAYRYLDQTIETFPSGHAFLHLLKQAHFTRTSQKRLMFGAVTIYQAHA